MKIGITGATGQLGQIIVEKLKTQINSESLVALVRAPEKAAGLGVEACEFDYSKLEDLVDALEGIERLLLISGNEIGQRAPQHKNVIEAAKKAGVKWIVYTSLLHADTSPLGLAEEHKATEAALKESGLEYTILRNGWYTENYAGSIPGAIANGAFIGSAGEGKISSAERVDYAEAAAVVITNEIHKGKTYELAGDESYILSDLAAEMSKHTGKDIPYNNLSEEEYAGILLNIGLPEGLAKMLANSDTGASKGGLFDDSHQLSKLIGRPTTPLSETLKRFLADSK